MDSCLNDKNVWITGASRGIGLAIAKRLAPLAANLLLSASSGRSFSNIPNDFDPAKTYFLAADMSASDFSEKLALGMKERAASIDVLVNNAGTARFDDLVNLSISDFDRMLSVNLRGAFIAIKAVLPSMIKRGSGVIVNIVSGAAVKAYRGSSVYGATKSGLLAMSRSLREEVREHGIKIIDILPGAVATGIWDEQSLQVHGGRMIQPDDIAQAVLSSIELALTSNALIEEMIIKPAGGDL